MLCFPWEGAPLTPELRLGWWLPSMCFHTPGALRKGCGVLVILQLLLNRALNSKEPHLCKLFSCLLNLTYA